MKPKPFDFLEAVKLENYIRRRYREQLGNGVLSFYFCAFQPLERAGLGLCQPITATYPELAAVGFRNPSRIKEALTAISGVLCEVLPGSPIKNGGKATTLRRYSLTELMNDEPRRKLIDPAPAEARELAEFLYSRTFAYGKEPACRPSWNVLKTGRVQSRKPNVQGDPENKRIKNLCAGLQPGQVLIYADYKQAEPTIIQNAIGYHFEADPYQTAADLLGIDRDSAKPKVNQLAYFPDSKAALRFWQCPPAEAVFLPYVEALTAYKEKLWTAGTPHGKQRRFTNTLAGRKIEADRGKAAHRGQVLSWQIQGTVADILNAACLKIIELETSKHWKLCFPVHDAAYVIGTPEQAVEIGQIMEAEAARLRLPLTVKVKTFGAGDVICKSEQ
jgi:hypothetical protein